MTVDPRAWIPSPRTLLCQTAMRQRSAVVFLLVATIAATFVTIHFVRLNAERTPDDESGTSDSTSGAKTHRIESVTAEDAAVFSLVLEDLATGEGNDMPAIGLPDASRTQIVIDPHTIGKSHGISDDELHGEFRLAAWQPDDEATKNLQERNEEPVSLGKIDLGEHCIQEDFDKLRNDGDSYDLWSKIEEKHPQAKAYVILWLPGYSTSKGEVIVRFAIGPSAHGAHGTYYFVKENGKWIIKYKRCSYYS